MVWLILKAKKLRRLFNNEVYINKKEIGKKDALIEEQENKLTSLQKKLADQQGVVSEALLRTIRTLTGYDADQLPIFFRSLTQIRENPLQKADHQAITAPLDQDFEEEHNDSIRINESKEKLVPNVVSLENNAAKEEKASGNDSPEENDSKKEKLASNDDSDKASDTSKAV